MAKFLSRIGHTKKDYNLICNIQSFEANGYFTLGEEKKPAKVTIQYIRGKTVLETTPFSFLGGKAEVNQTFEKVVDIYKDEKKGVF
jgi:hypothetical protein